MTEAVPRRAGLSEQDEAAAQWWATAVSHIEPGMVELRGRPVEQLIGSVGIVDMMWLLLRGDLPAPRQSALLEAALVAGVDHGPQAPSIAAARMAATCGIGLNNAIATGVNMLGDVHGGAGEQCVEMLTDIRRLRLDGQSWDDAARETMAAWQRRSRYLPGFGHRFHPVDPRRDPLLRLVEDAVAAGDVTGDYLQAAYAIERVLRSRRAGARPVPMNIDGATAVIYAELGFPAPLARGLFVLSRSVGILAHAWEESGQGRRNKGPIPRHILPARLPAPREL
ncbi:citryl-CoA lyase [Streptomyces sp. CBMA29]|uniref:citryl-CoA lyase n=1 Tax=Streptomyces sp. CBMA29 TaxID=1896314 RepID=UPI001661F170|nr:citryl-CoA lyase [Streptomyces sp. CBMA29]MBD0735148.1 citryl-CoA lyase [Streptomyces sp. CBMA29]